MRNFEIGSRIFRVLVISALAAAILGGCSKSTLPEATGKGTINALNAMPQSPGVNFLIEERLLGTVGYKGTLGKQPFDDLSYNFNFEFLFPGDTEATRLATQFIDVVADTDYTLVLTGSVFAPVVTQWERPTREWQGTETVFEVGFAHLSPALGDVDVYLAPTGTAPVLGEERAKLSFGDTMPPIDLESEQYELIITARDDPSTILYQSYDSFFSARLSYTIGIFDPDASITGNISVRSISSDGFASELPDSNFLPTLRTIHAAFGTENIDIYRDEDFTAPIYSDLGFGAETGDLAVPDGISIYSYTAVGNPGAIINEETQLLPQGTHITTVLAGMPGGDLLRMILTDNRRSIETHAKLRFIQAAANFATMDTYLVDAGADITDLSPTISGLPYGIATDFVAQIANDYEVILTLPGEKTVIAGPIALNLVEGDVVEVLILDTVDPLVADTIVTAF